MQPTRARHWLRTLLPAHAPCRGGDAVAPGRTLLQQFASTYTAGLVATLAFIA